MSESPKTSSFGAGSKTVLVVDDDVDMCRAVERVLGSAKFDVTIANGPGSAIALLTSRSFDVIVSDIQMPEMNGVALLRVIRSYDLDVPVILVTGEPSLETAVEAVSLGAFQYLMKPLENAVLVKSVERASRLHRLTKLRRDALALTGDVGGRPSDRAGLGASFESALGSMWMAFQPIVDIHAKSVFAYEALMRSGEASLPHPGAILEAAERLGRLPELGRRVRSLSATAFEAAPPDVLLFVNLHTQDLLDETLFEPRSPLGKLADRVVLEITERASLDAITDIEARIGKLRTHGFRLAVDDLGAGYAGLTSFAALEPEFVKLDMSLIRNVHRSPIRERLVVSMTALCDEMNIKVIGEGVESAEECECVSRAGCTLLQGYFFAKPAHPFPEVSFA